ncbi:MAG: 5'-methylthioadenosine/S-adenosylhomocysteine nucleosidase [Firmicutes bacterium]|nr:5'-methylthioadenosine/S-adenosylhomocysteine nucleosidase [Bacillota bacterium]
MLGIVCAMHSELEGLRAALDLEPTDFGGPWTIYRARKQDILAVVCGVGKVNAAAALAYLLSLHPLKAVIGVGVAGAIAKDLQLGDVVVCSGALQHDMDASAFGYEVGMVPVLGKKLFSADQTLVREALQAGENAGLTIKVRSGTVLSGDKFVAGAENARLRELFQGDCVDMETAAWAQVALLFKVPWVALRSISDQADGQASKVFSEFLNLAVQNMSAVILQMIAARQAID